MELHAEVLFRDWQWRYGRSSPKDCEYVANCVNASPGCFDDPCFNFFQTIRDLMLAGY